MRRTAEIAFLILIFSLAFMQPDLNAFGPTMTLTEPVSLATGLIFAVAVIARQARLRFDRIYILFILYAAALTLSAVFSENRGGSLVRLAGDLYLVALAVLTFNIVRTPAMLKRTVLVWLAASGVSALIGTLAVGFFYLGVSNFVTQFAFHYYGSLPPGNYVRIQGTFLYPSMLCNYLTVSVMMLIAARRQKLISKMAATVLGSLIAITILFTVTPGIGGVLFAIGWWIYLAFVERGRPGVARVAMAAGALALAAFLAVSTFTVIPETSSPITFSVGGTRVDASHRFMTWSGALETFAAHPFLGRGPGLGVAEVYVRTPSNTVELLTDAHNMFLNVAGQAGILGIATLLSICIAVVRRSMPFGLGDNHAVRAALGIAFVSAFLIQGLIGSFEDARYLWVVMGLILAVRGMGDEKGSGTSRPSTTTSI